MIVKTYAMLPWFDDEIEVELTCEVYEGAPGSWHDPEEPAEMQDILSAWVMNGPIHVFEIDPEEYIPWGEDLYNEIAERVEEEAVYRDHYPEEPCYSSDDW